MTDNRIVLRKARVQRAKQNQAKLDQATNLGEAGKSSTKKLEEGAVGQLADRSDTAKA